MSECLDNNNNTSQCVKTTLINKLNSITAFDTKLSLKCEMLEQENAHS